MITSSPSKPMYSFRIRWFISMPISIKLNGTNVGTDIFGNHTVPPKNVRNQPIKAVVVLDEFLGLRKHKMFRTNTLQSHRKISSQKCQRIIRVKINMTVSGRCVAPTCTTHSCDISRLNLRTQVNKSVVT